MLRHSDLDKSYIKLLIRIYDISKTRIRTDVGITTLINLLKGTKQGGILSAILFCFALAIIFAKTFEETNVGVSIGGECYGDFSYADDAALLTEDESSMQILMSKLHENAKEFGLEINFGKTKLMYVGKNRNYPRQHITLAGQDVEVVKQFDYLGRILSCDGDDCRNPNQ